MDTHGGKIVIFDGILIRMFACTQTGQYSTQIFSLAVLLSSLFVYNQMGGIDEAALDRLSLVTEMTKHIRVRAGSAGGSVLMLLICQNQWNFCKNMVLCCAQPMLFLALPRLLSDRL